MGTKRNIGWVDMLFRIILSLIMIYFGFIDNSVIDDEVARMMLGIIGSISMLIALIGICPFYLLIGYNTCKHKHDN